MPICKSALSSLAMLLAATLAAGCSSSLSSSPGTTASIDASASAGNLAPPKAPPARVALLLPLAGFGEPAQIARGMRQAAEMALFDANDPSIQLIVKDDGASPEGARQAANAAISEGAEVILGPLLSKAAAGAADAARPSQIPVVSFSNDPAVAGNGVYLMSFLAADEVSRVVSYAARQGKRRFVALIPANAYGQTIEQPFRRAVAEAGIELTAAEIYQPDANGLLEGAKRILAKIKAAEAEGRPIDAMFMPGGPDEIAQLGPLFGYSGIDTKKTKLIGTSAWDIPFTGRDNALAGAWYASPDPAAWIAFSQKFQAHFGQPPPRLATLAYDAMNMAIDLARTPPPARYGDAAITRPAGFPGVDGIVHFSTDGKARRGLAVLEIGKRGSAVIDPAPGASVAVDPRVSSVDP
ncbi:MAG TPA: penicillin-binding protein activator [Hyphomicrobium sp.]|nr:penicillin-binding protein activator [Hyphomicrobium sp.]